MRQNVKILVYRLSSLGDIILTYNFLKQLKDIYPDSEIIYLTKKHYKEVIELSGFVNEVVAFEDLKNVRKFINESGFHIIYDLHKTFNSFVTFLFNKNVIRYKKQTFARILLVLLKYNISNKYIPVYEKYINTLHSTPIKFVPILKNKIKKSIMNKYIVVSPSSKHFTKRYPVDKYIEVLKSLKIKIYLTGDGSNTDNEICEKIKTAVSDSENISGKIGFYKLSELINGAEYVICNDSGILHLSEALGKKVFVFFGSTVKEFGFAPALETTEIFEINNLQCRPCTKIGRSECPLGNLKCLDDIEPKKVINKIKNY